MHIGVDAGALAITDDRLKVGVYRVTFELLKELAVLDEKNTYSLFTFRPIRGEILKALGPRMKQVIVRPALGWATVQLPLYLRLHPVDLFLGVSQYVPSTCPNAIGFVYDVGFLRYPEAYPGSLHKLATQTKDAVRRSRTVVTISEASKKDIVQTYKRSPASVIVSFPGIASAFTPFGNLQKEKHPYFLFVGSQKRLKNVPTLLAAFAQFLKTSRRAYTLVLVGGDYWRDSDIRKALSGLHLEKHVKETGHIPDDMLATYYRGAVGLIIPSLWEGFGLPVVEAFGCGCPVIASTAGALPEIVGDAGILVAPKSVLGYMQAMKTLANKPDVRRALREKGCGRAKVFSWRTFAQNVFSLYSSS